MRTRLLTVAVAIWAALAAGLPLRPLSRAEIVTPDVDALITDCASALASYTGPYPELAASFQSAEVQAIAKKIADTLDKPITDSDIHDPHIEGLSMDFKTALNAQVPSSLLPKDEFGLARNRIDFMTPRQAFSCFPDLVAVARKYVSRVEAARQAVKQKQQEEAQRQQGAAARAKLPDNVLATAYASYIDVKRCYEARESYAAGYISYEEMELAKSAVHQIEEELKPKLAPNIRADDVWSQVEQIEGRSFYPSRDFGDRDNKLCRRRLALLFQLLREQVPASGRIEKDF